MSNKPKVVRTLLITHRPHQIWKCPDCDSTATPSHTGADYNIEHDNTCPYLAHLRDNQ